MTDVTMNTGVPCPSCAGKASWQTANGVESCVACLGVGFVPTREPGTPVGSERISRRDGSDEVTPSSGRRLRVSVEGAWAAGHSQADDDLASQAARSLHLEESGGQGVGS